MQRNRELIDAKRELQEQNKLLEESARSERTAHEQLKASEAHLVQTEKLAGLGMMVAGVAHEINNPLAFVDSNMVVLDRDLAAIQRLLEMYRKADPALAKLAQSDGGAVAGLVAEIHDLDEAIDVDYTLPNLRDVLARSREGLRRIKETVLNLKDFARLDATVLSEADVNAGINSTIQIIRNKATERAVKIDTQLSPLPVLSCYPAKINQVIMNLIDNAIDASPSGGTITVRTSAADSAVRIDVVDKGAGIDPAIRDRIFDPFFTTKPQGKGTGLGLAISYGIARDHGGSIEVDSTPGQGSTFTVVLPMREPST